jgi:hypothetical protein
MKLFIAVILLCAFAMSSCKAPNFAIGTSEKEFLAKTKSEVVLQTDSTSVYRRTNQPFGGEYQIKYFYFKRGILMRIDEGKPNGNLLLVHHI